MSTEGSGVGPLLNLLIKPLRYEHSRMLTFTLWATPEGNRIDRIDGT